MKILVVGWGTTGDISPALFLGSELGRRGHDVIFIGNPYFEAFAKGLGISFAGVGRREDHERLLADTDLFYRERKSQYQGRSEYYFPFLEQLFNTTESLAEPGRTMLLNGEDASACVAYKLAMPWVKIILAPSLTGYQRFDPPHPHRMLPPWAAYLSRTPVGMRVLWKLNSLRLWRHWLRSVSAHRTGWPDDHPLAALRTRVGLPANEKLKPGMSLCVWPDWFAAPQPDWPENFRITEFLLPRQTAVIDDPDFRMPLNQPIVFTTGSVASGQAHFFDAALETCQRLKKPGYFVTPNADQVPSRLPADIDYSAHAPFDKLFRQSAMVVHHGGIGTAALALAAGIPQVLCPMRGDQFDNANRLQRLGVGKMIDARGINSDSLTSAISQMMNSSSVANSCDHWREQMTKEDGIRRGADLVENFAGNTPGLAME